MPRLIQPLPDGPLDIIGDVHGELTALRRLLARLGCDTERATVERPLVFVGDLVDRGPDSPGVVTLVQRLVEAGVAYCIAGNHELNLLQADHKEGNGWFFGHNDGFHDQGRLRPFPSREVTDPAERASIRSFLATLPLALARPGLRVVHACWDQDSLDRLPVHGDLATLAEAAQQAVLADLQQRGVLALAAREREHFQDLRDPAVRPDRELRAALEVTLAEQRLNPFRVLTSGKEHAIALEDVFFVGGKWRLADRTRWWNDHHHDDAVVIGHYWRRRTTADAGKRDLWDDVPPTAWAGPRGNVFCVDYSVGRRFLERWRHRAAGRTEAPFQGTLAALRWPERTLWFDDGDGPMPTTGFGAHARP